MPRVCCIKPFPTAREMGVVEGLAKSEGTAPIDQAVRVAKAPRALLGVRDLADSERVRRKEAIVVDLEVTTRIKSSTHEPTVEVCFTSRIVESRAMHSPQNPLFWFPLSKATTELPLDRREISYN